MVEYQGAAGLRGGMHRFTHNRKGTCSATSVFAEASYMSPASVCYYSPEVHPPTPTENFFDDATHGNMRNDIAPTPSPR
eukprot:7544345-Pyramimonas_sp.AAC.1